MVGRVRQPVPAPNVNLAPSMSFPRKRESRSSSKRNRNPPEGWVSSRGSNTWRSASSLTTPSSNRRVPPHVIPGPPEVIPAKAGNQATYNGLPLSVAIRIVRLGFELEPTLKGGAPSDCRLLGWRQDHKDPDLLSGRTTKGFCPTRTGIHTQCVIASPRTRQQPFECF
jgi:hypothetical protein